MYYERIASAGARSTRSMATIQREQTARAHYENERARADRDPECRLGAHESMAGFGLLFAKSNSLLSSCLVSRMRVLRVSARQFNGLLCISPLWNCGLKNSISELELEQPEWLARFGLSCLGHTKNQSAPRISYLISSQFISSHSHISSYLFQEQKRMKKQNNNTNDNRKSRGRRSSGCLTSGGRSKGRPIRRADPRLLLNASRSISPTLDRGSRRIGKDSFLA